MASKRSNVAAPGNYRRKSGGTTFVPTIRKVAIRTARPNNDKASDKPDATADKPKKESAKPDKGLERTEGALPDVVAEFIKEAVRKGVAGLKMEFMENRSYVPPNYNINIDLAGHKKNQPEGRNRFQDVFCLESTRVVLKNHTTDYIHANRVNGGTMHVICTQGPKDNTIIDFWYMVWQEDCGQIVMLCNTVESGKPKCAAYWPEATGTTATHGTFTIAKTSEEIEELKGGDQQLVTSNLEVTNEGFAPRTVVHRHWRNWPDRGAPTDVHALLHLRLNMARCQVGKHVVVHCSAGIGRTGTLVLVDMGQVAMDCKRPFDMVVALKKLRDQRLHSIQTDMQYLFVYRALIDYSTKKWKGTVPGLDKWMADYHKAQPQTK